MGGVVITDCCAGGEQGRLRELQHGGWKDATSLLYKMCVITKEEWGAAIIVTTQTPNAPHQPPPPGMKCLFGGRGDNKEQGRIGHLPW